MAQASRPAADHIATFPNSDAGPYSADQWAELLALTHVGDPNTTGERAQLRGVVPTAWNHLVVTNPAGVTIRVASGAAWVNGHIFVHDPTVAPAAPLDFTPSTPAADRIDRVVVVVNNTNAAYNTNLEFPTDLTDYAAAASVPAYTCRLAILTGVAGGAMRALVQTANYWMIEIARYTITNVPAISVGPTDYRAYAQIEHIIGATDVDGMADGLIIGTELDAGVALAGLGTSIAAQLEDAGGTRQAAGRLAWRWHTPTAGAEVAQVEVRTEYITSEVLSGVIVAPQTASADGNARGVGSVDLQGYRTGVAQVASGSYAALSGGSQNTASGANAVIGGGDQNIAGALANATVGGGSGNTASGAGSTIAGGSASTASGDYAMIPGGSANIADGDYSLAAGRQADTNSFNGVFIWADSEAAAFAADRADQFKVRASGGTHLVQNNAAAALPVLRLAQTDTDESFIDFVGTSAADQTKSISTVNGDGVVTGPKDFAASAGWAFVGMVRIEINGVEYWMPFYQPDLS